MESKQAKINTIIAFYAIRMNLQFGQAWALLAWRSAHSAYCCCSPIAQVCQVSKSRVAR